MLSCHNLWFLLVIVIFSQNSQTESKPYNEAVEDSKTTSPHLELITDDVIHDQVEQDIKKVIRVNPLDLPPLKDNSNIPNMDSSLYKIQSHKNYNGKRKYVNLQRSKPLNEVTAEAVLSNAPIIRGFSLLPTPDKTSKAKYQPKKNNLHFLYNQEDLTGNLLSKSMPVRVAPGAYPVYYLVAKTNGSFGKYPLKSFSSAQDFMKYLQKNKFENTPVLKTDKKDKISDLKIK